MNTTFKRLALIAAFVCVTAQASAAESTYAEGTWSVSARAGIAPTTSKGKTNVTNTVNTFGAKIPAGNTDITKSATVLRQTQAKNFGKIYGLPFTFGMDVGYFVEADTEVFFGIDYTRAKSKKLSFPGKLGTLDAASTNKFRPYNSIGAYVGGRHYFEAMGAFVPFAGAKLGVKRVSGSSSKDTVTANFKPETSFKYGAVRNGTSFSGGLQLGCDYVLNQSTSLTFMSEVVGSSSKLFKKKAVEAQKATATKLGLTTEVTRTPGATLSFPITFGVRFRM